LATLRPHSIEIATQIRYLLAIMRVFDLTTMGAVGGAALRPQPSMLAITFMRPPQRPHCSISSPKVLLGTNTGVQRVEKATRWRPDNVVRRRAGLAFDGSSAP